MSEEEVITTEETGGVLGSDVSEQPQEPVSTEGIAPQYTDFLDGLPDHLKTNDTLQNTKSFESLADQLVNAQKALGAKRLQLPQDDWTEKDYNNFYSQLRPANDEYEIPDTVEGIEEMPTLPEGAEQELVDFAGKMGLTQTQFDMLHEQYIKMGIEGSTLDSEAQQKQVVEYRTAMKTEWGDNFDHNVRQANEAYQALTSEIPELKDLVETNGEIANHPAVLKLFHRISEVSGDTLPLSGNNPTSGFATETIHNIRSELAGLDAQHNDLIMSNPSTLSIPDRNKRQQILQERADLYAKMYPSKVN
tara:strand:- start:12948 stop:13862 length:915 start_codon:yes stop_codon:yes gene_type:complete